MAHQTSAERRIASSCTRDPCVRTICSCNDCVIIDSDDRAADVSASDIRIGATVGVFTCASVIGDIIIRTARDPDDYRYSVIDLSDGTTTTTTSEPYQG